MHGDLRGDTAIRVTQWFPLIAQPNAIGDTIAQVGNAVWMVRGPRWIVLGSALNPTSTTLPVRATFVPWLADAISNLASGTTAATITAPNAPITAPGGATELRSADNKTRRAVTAATVAAPAIPGLYFWMNGSDVIGAVGVQLGREEPQLGRATSSELLQRFGGSDRAIVNADVTPFLASVRQSGASRPMAVPLLILALMAVLAEAWLSGRYRTRGSTVADSQPRPA